MILKVSNSKRNISVLISVVTFLLLFVVFLNIPLFVRAFSYHHIEPLPIQLNDNFNSTINFHSIMKLSKGTFLVASENLIDSNFSESVVLLIEFDRYGTRGLIINRPTKVKLSEALPKIKELPQDRDTLFLGGPVATNQISILIQSSNQPEKSVHVFQDVYASSSWEAIQQMTDSKDNAKKYRAYAGFAGWIPGQLEKEISRGDWHVLSADPETIFKMKSSEIWIEMIHRSSGQWV